MEGDRGDTTITERHVSQRLLASKFGVSSPLIVSLKCCIKRKKPAAYRFKNYAHLHTMVAPILRRH